MSQDHPPDGIAQYNIAAIRNLIRDAFTAEDLKRFCKDRPLFSSIPDHFGSNFSLMQMIDVTVEQCEKRALLSDLLAAIQEANPRRYSRFERRLLIEPERGDAAACETTPAAPSPPLGADVPGSTPLLTQQAGDGEQLPLVEIVTPPGQRVRGWLTQVLRDPAWQGVAALITFVALVVALCTWFWPDIGAILFPTPMPTHSPSAYGAFCIRQSNREPTVIPDGEGIEVTPKEPLILGLCTADGLPVSNVTCKWESSSTGHIANSHGCVDVVYQAPNSAPDILTLTVTDTTAIRQLSLTIIVKP